MLQCSQAGDLPNLTETKESDRQGTDQSIKPISSKSFLLPLPPDIYLSSSGDVKAYKAKQKTMNYNLKYQRGFSDFLDILLTRIQQRNQLFFALFYWVVLDKVTRNCSLIN